MPYNHIELEQKWQKFWESNQTFATENPPFNTQKPKKYILDMFPYPSGAGLHVGHPKGYTATDIISRYYHANGYNVLHTMGWDAFGLPAENYAIKTGTHPAVTTAQNIETFLGQMKLLGFSYDWSREIDTTDPNYYQWTQWIFLELFKRGLAYESELPVNWCPVLKTVLANEEVINGLSEIGGHPVERKPMRQWVLKITEYADRLIEDLEGLNWPEGVKEMQRNWIGKSEGCEFRMMKKTEGKPVALILHGLGDVGGGHWASWLAIELQKIGYEVRMPTVPFGSGDITECLDKLDEYKQEMNENSLIISHSMGSVLGMKFIESLDIKIDTFISIAGVFEGMSQDKALRSSESLREISHIFAKLTDTKMDYERIRKNISHSIICTSDNDSLIDKNEQEAFFRRYGFTDKYLVFPGKDHFSTSRGNVTKLPELLAEVFPSIEVYTTRVDTVYGMTYAVLAPDHPRVYDFITAEQSVECEAYITEAASRSDQDRTNEGKEKTGVFTGSYVVNPFNGESVPLWIADYVLGHYGTGAVMAVPAHDERDFAFAKRYDLPVRQSIAPYLIMGGKNSPKEGFQKTQRKTVNAIIEYNGQYLVLKEPENYRLLGGGIESGETSIETIKREIIEETGYSDFAEVGEISFSQVFAHGFHHKKQHNNESHDLPCFYVRLNTLEQQEVDSSELAWHSITWVEKSEVAKLLSFEQHQFQWGQFLRTGAYPIDGVLVNSSGFDGLTSAEARKILSEKAESEGFGRKKVNYKLRDWLFSRQRYWGEPIPLIHISHEDYAKLPRIEELEDAKAGEASVIARNEAIQEQNKDSFLHAGSPRFARDDGAEEYLIIDGKVYSKIYDGISSKIVIDSDLPLRLPQVEKYEPAGDGQSPLATVSSFVHVKLADNLSGKRETNTMPQWGGSCWYYLRYMDPRNSDALASRETLDYWQNVDEYVGGAEHAVLHLLYARFWHKVLYDIGVVPTKEPFQKLTNVGMILAYAYERADGGLVAVDLVEGKDGKYFETSTGKEVNQVVAKMSKSLKNVVNPNDIVREYGADTLRLYEMSMGAFTDTAPWNPEAIIGVRRFLDKTYTTFTMNSEQGTVNNENDPEFPLVKGGRGDFISGAYNLAKDDMKAMKLLHKTIKKVGEDIVGYKFNTAISALQILLNEGLPKDNEFQKEWKEKFTILLHPFAPHMAEELWSLIGNTTTIYGATWPKYDEFMLVDDEVIIAVQVGGKLRGTFTFLNGVGQEEVSAVIRADEGIKKWIDGKEIMKEIFIPNKMLSIVIKE